MGVFIVSYLTGVFGALIKLDFKTISVHWPILPIQVSMKKSEFNLKPAIDGYAEGWRFLP